MLIIHPVSYRNTLETIFEQAERQCAPSLLDVNIPGMISISGLRLCLACKNLPIQKELARRELKQKFSAGDFFTLGNVDSGVITVGCNHDPSVLGVFVEYAKSLGKEVDFVLLNDVDDDPEFETFCDVIMDNLAVRRLDVDQLKSAQQMTDKSRRMK